MIIKNWAETKTWNEKIIIKNRAETKRCKSATFCSFSYFYLIFWCANFVERHSFRRVSGETKMMLAENFLNILRTLIAGKQDIYCAYKTRLQNVLDVFLTSCVCSIRVLCPWDILWNKWRMLARMVFTYILGDFNIFS